MTTTELTIPGKLFLAGEYAVTRPGQPAILAAIDQGMTLTVSSSASLAVGQVQIESDAIDTPLLFSWEDFKALVQTPASQVQKTSWSYVQIACALFYQEHPLLNLQVTPGLSIKIQSQMRGEEGKLGLGSSAAVTVGTIKGLAQYYGCQDSPLALFQQAAFAHYYVQGSGSLGDAASATYTGVIAYQAPAWLGQVDQTTLTLADFSHLDWDQLKITPINWPENWQLAIVATFSPASTQKALAKNFWSDSFAQESQRIMGQVQKAIHTTNYPSLKDSLQANQDLLGANLPAGYLTKALAAFLTILDQEPLAGKVSGAGFGDNGFVVFTDQDQIEAFSKAIQPIDLHLILPRIYRDSHF
ncbi:phosphomevalonate kinase [Fructobacillus pseudoficulneus]|uniref:phosphomevalonate kinase n=1 Tax=Fructobacillus pseudoficulneus TaxID=220714 RepID=A0A3F3GWV9_9LACO|nr:phosphomevalonate kinase [Fructobacillus pseudoficulneus]GAP02662.1 phosphomevalonate kinase [Fructobacillus pseudoficulneus]SEH38895.1 phosphomevalonate kinase [Fructobacillus pseudoficulneus]